MFTVEKINFWRLSSDDSEDSSLALGGAGGGGAKIQGGGGPVGCAPGAKGSQSTACTHCPCTFGCAEAMDGLLPAGRHCGIPAAAATFPWPFLRYMQTWLFIEETCMWNRKTPVERRASQDPLPCPSSTLCSLCALAGGCLAWETILNILKTLPAALYYRNQQNSNEGAHLCQGLCGHQRQARHHCHSALWPPRSLEFRGVMDSS